jgi:hypothetical protein
MSFEHWWNSIDKDKKEVHVENPKLVALCVLQIAHGLP